MGKKTTIQKITTVLTKKLTDEHRLMVIIRNELYEGSWEEMEKDLRDRLNGRPVIEKLVEKIKRDLAYIEDLRLMGKEAGINLTTLL